MVLPLADIAFYPSPILFSCVLFYHTAGPTAGTSGSTAPVTFCLDFHRPGTAPGLGDKNKHSALLYRCQAAHMTQVRGLCVWGRLLLHPQYSTLSSCFTALVLDLRPV